MMKENEIKKIEEITKELLSKMTVTDFEIETQISFTLLKIKPNLFTVESTPKVIPIKSSNTIFEFLTKSMTKEKVIPKKEGNLDIVNLNIKLKEPQILIGSNGQTLSEIERLLRIILNKKLGKYFYLELDINEYKKKKIEYLKGLAKNLADTVSLTKEKKILSPMPAYQRRIIHMELSQRQDIKTESAGDGEDRYIIINPR